MDLFLASSFSDIDLVVWNVFFFLDLRVLLECLVLFVCQIPERNENNITAQDRIFDFLSLLSFQKCNILNNIKKFRCDSFLNHVSSESPYCVRLLEYTDAGH